MLVSPLLILPKGNRPYNKPCKAVKITQPKSKILTYSGKSTEKKIRDVSINLVNQTVKT